MLAAVGVSLIGIVILIASIDDLGLVGGSEARYSSALVALAGAVLLAAPAIGAWVRWRSEALRYAVIIIAAAFGVTVVTTAVSGSLALGALGWFGTQLVLLALLDR